MKNTGKPSFFVRATTLASEAPDAVILLCTRMCVQILGPGLMRASGPIFWDKSEIDN